MFEETGLRVDVGALLLDEDVAWGAITRRKTFLCTAPAGDPKPGCEPESEYASDFEFTAVQWIDLRCQEDWPEEIVSDTIKLELLRGIRSALGYV
jgi:8-oxo-dGTP pyrophosphatase MutT (NUDIX family)